jgi:serine/threonine-protein kinase
MQRWATATAQRAERTRLTARLESGVQLVQSERFAEARAILGKLGDGGFDDLRSRIDRVLHDLDLAEELDAIGVARATVLNARDTTWRPNSKAATDYETHFSRAIGKMTDNPSVVAERIRASDIEAPLIAALDDWAVCETDPVRRDWILEVAQRADADRQDWQDRLRNPATWSDQAELARLVESSFSAKASVHQLRALGDRMSAAGLDATPFRHRVQQGHVDNFLANLSLGDALSNSDSAEAVRFYQAALAIRPHSATARNNLAVALSHLGRSEEAIDQFSESLALDPDSAAIQYNLGVELSKTSPLEAISHLQKATKLDSKLAAVHRTLGEYFMQEHRYSEAHASLSHCLLLLREESDRNAITNLIRRCEAHLTEERKQ